MIINTVSPEMKNVGGMVGEFRNIAFVRSGENSLRGVMDFAFPIIVLERDLRPRAVSGFSEGCSSSVSCVRNLYTFFFSRIRVRKLQI